ncbi:MAG: fibronectin type III domain-containing protein [Verrucomicrobiales bacterium]
MQFLVEGDPDAPIESNSGVVALEWVPANPDEAEGIEFELEKSETADFSEATVLYRGPDRSTILTGVRAGDYFYRVRTADGGRWSKPIRAEVEYIQRGRLFALLGIGLVVVGLTVAAIVGGHFKSSRESS